MDKQKQIKEMAKILGNSCLWKQYGSLNCYDCKYYSQENHVCCSFGNKEAEMFYEAGYRKADDVIDEFVERFIKRVTENNTDDGYLSESIDYYCLIEDIKELAVEMQQEVKSEN